MGASGNDLRCQGATPMSLEGAKKLSLRETEMSTRRARNDQQKKQGKTLRTWVASRWTSERFSMLSYVPNHFPILYVPYRKRDRKPLRRLSQYPYAGTFQYDTGSPRGPDIAAISRHKGGVDEPRKGRKRGRYDIGARCGATVLRFWDFAVIRAVIVATLQQPLYPPGWG